MNEDEEPHGYRRPRLPINAEVVDSILENYEIHRRFSDKKKKARRDDNEITVEPNNIGASTPNPTKPDELPNGTTTTTNKPDDDDQAEPVRTLSANEWFAEGGRSAFQSMRNLTTLQSQSDQDFANELEDSFRRFIQLANFVRKVKLTQPGANSHGQDENTNNILVPNTSGIANLEQIVLRSSNPALGEEFYMMLSSLFIHIFIQLFERGYYNNAQNLINEYQSRFKASRGKIIKLMSLSLAQGVLQETFAQFKNYKAKVLITEETFAVLQLFLKRDENLSLLQVMNAHLDFRVMSQDEYAATKMKGPGDTTTFKTIMPVDRSQVEGPLDKFMTRTESMSKEMTNLLQCIKTVRDLSPPRPSLSDLLVCQLELRQEGIASVAMSANLTKLAAGSEHSAISLWDFDLVDQLQYYSARVYRHWRRIPVRRIASDVDFKWVNFRKVAENGSFKEEFDSDDEEDRFPDRMEPHTLRGHSGPVYEMAFVERSNMLLSASGDASLRCWDCNSGACLATYQGHSSAVFTLDANESGCFLSGGADGTAYQWDLERTAPLRLYAGHSMDINRIRFHPNSNYLATASSDKCIILWDVNQVRQVRMFTGHRGPVSTIAFSGCGKFLASAADDGAVRLWDISMGACVQEFGGGGEEGWKLAVGGKSLAFGDQDRLLACSDVAQRAVRVWKNPAANGTQRPYEYPEMVQLTSPSSHSVPLQVTFLRDNLILALAKVKPSR